MLLRHSAQEVHACDYEGGGLGTRRCWYKGICMPVVVVVPLTCLSISAVLSDALSLPCRAREACTTPVTIKQAGPS